MLDEADHMADLGFLPAVSQVLDTVPGGGQRLLFSATLDNAIDHLVRNYLHEPVTHQVDTGQASVPLMSHHLVSIAPQHKAAVTAEIANRPGRTLIFVRTQRGADRVAERLRRSGVLAGALHGGLAGRAPRIMSAFKHGSLPVLVATDVARAASTSTRSVWSSTLTRRTGRRSICTARDVLPGRAGRAPSSPSRCRTSVASWAV